MASGYGATAPPMEDENPNGKYNINFSQQSIRAAFVRKVFTLVTIMFAIVAGLCVIPMASEPFRLWAYNNFYIYLIAICVFIALSFVLCCCQSILRTFPINLIFLTLFTLSAGVMTMFVTATYNVQSVLIALCITTVCSASVIGFAMYTKKDLTSHIGLAFILSMSLLCFGLFASIFTLAFGWVFLNSVYAGLGAALMMFYLAIDVQMLMGGRKFELSPEDYVYAAVMIFLDILNMFLYILQIVGKSN